MRPRSYPRRVLLGAAITTTITTITTSCRRRVCRCRVAAVRCHQRRSQIVHASEHLWLCCVQMGYGWGETF